MLKKLFTFFFIILCSLCLTGCINVKVADEFTVNKDRSIDHSFQILIGNNMAGFADQINSALSENLSEQGYSNIVDAYDSDSFGKKGTNHFEIDKEIGSALQNNYVSVTDNSTDYFVFKHVDITANINFQEILNKNRDAELITFQEYKLTINLPVAFTETNAQNVYNEGKSATWRFAPSSGSGTVHFECNLPNAEHIRLILICVAGLFGFILFIKIVSFAASKKYYETCPNCGSKIAVGGTFCGNCGYKLVNDIFEDEVTERCPQCGAELIEDALFCGNCGYKLSQDNPTEPVQDNTPRCPQCGAEINEDDLFCGNCGYKLNNEDNNEV